MTAEHDAFNAFGGTNAQEDISTVDLQVMDVIGWNRIIPEPAGLSLLSCAAATLLARRRR